MDRIDLEAHAKTMLGELIYGESTFDPDKLREDVAERATEEADNACIYTHHCLQIIQDYERHESVPNESELGGSFRSDQWTDAAQAWAWEIAEAVIRAEADGILQVVIEKAESLCETINELRPDDTIEPEDLAVSLTCPHGWAPHSKEDHDGAHYWGAYALEGSNAIGIDAGPFWLSYTWTPEPAGVPNAPA